MFFIPRQRDEVPFNRASRAIKKSATVCAGLAAKFERPIGAYLQVSSINPYHIYTADSKFAMIKGRGDRESR